MMVSGDELKDPTKVFKLWIRKTVNYATIVYAVANNKSEAKEIAIKTTTEEMWGEGQTSFDFEGVTVIKE